mgnify:CR=1 FL=1
MSFNTATSQLGQIGKAGSETALYLEMYAGEVMKTFRQKNIMMPLHRVKMVGAGKSFQFPVMGEATAGYHTRDVNILDPANNLLTQFEHGRRTINMDKILMSNVLRDNWDELIAHYETRSEYSAQIGLALAYQMDRDLLQLGCLAAREGATLQATQSATKSGLQLAVAGASTSADVMVDQMVLAATAFEEKDVDMSGVTFIVRPSMYYQMVDSGRLLNTDFGNAGNGSQAMGKVLKGYGFPIMTTNHLPDSVIASVAGQNNTYSGDFTQTAALALHRDAIGTVVRQGVMTEMDYRQEFQATLLTTKIVTGHGILRPEGAIEILDTDL